MGLPKKMESAADSAERGAEDGEQEADDDEDMISLSDEEVLQNEGMGFAEEVEELLTTSAADIPEGNHATQESLPVICLDDSPAQPAAATSKASNFGSEAVFDPVKGSHLRELKQRLREAREKLEARRLFLVKMYVRSCRVDSTSVQ